MTEKKLELPVHWIVITPHNHTSSEASNSGIHPRFCLQVAQLRETDLNIVTLQDCKQELHLFGESSAISSKCPCKAQQRVPSFCNNSAINQHVHVARYSILLAVLIGHLQYRCDLL